MHARGVDINYELHSPPASASRPTLVLIHGFGASLDTWHDVMPRLTEMYPILRLDLKGFGRSGRPRDDRYSIDEHAEIVVSVVSAESLPRVVLVGHSYGGAVACLACVKLRERQGPRVSGLVLIDSASYQQRLPFYVSSLANPLTRWAAERTTPEWRARFVLRHLFVNKRRVDAARVERYARGLGMPGSDYAASKIAEQILPADFAEVTRIIQSLDVPTQIIWGSRDNAVPVAFARRLHHDIRGSKLAIIPDVGHMPHEECPEEVLRILLPFLDSLPSGSTFTV